MRGFFVCSEAIVELLSVVVGVVVVWCVYVKGGETNGGRERKRKRDGEMFACLCVYLLWSLRNCFRSSIDRLYPVGCVACVRMHFTASSCVKCCRVMYQSNGACCTTEHNRGRSTTRIDPCWPVVGCGVRVRLWPAQK